MGAYCCSDYFRTFEINYEFVDFSVCHQIEEINILIKINLMRIKDKIAKMSQSDDLNLQNNNGNTSFFYFIRLENVLIKINRELDKSLEMEAPINLKLIEKRQNKLHRFDSNQINNLNLSNNNCYNDDNEFCLLLEYNTDVDSSCINIISHNSYLEKLIKFLNEILKTEENKDEDTLDILENEIYHIVIRRI